MDRQQHYTDSTIASMIGETVRHNSPTGTEAILFGSRARNDARKDSDWDVLILIEGDKVTHADYDNILYPIRELGWQTDKMINPIIYTKQEWTQKEFTPFYKNVMAEGIKL